MIIVSNEYFPQHETISADEAVKSVFWADDKELVKFVNDVIGASHDPEASKVTHLQSEFVNRNSDEPMTYDKLFVDMLFSINDKIYNLEIQTRHDKAMLCRMTEYQFSAMLQNMSGTEFPDEYEGTVSLPRMAVIQLEESKNVPDQYKLWFKNETTGEKLLQEFPIIKLWEHSIEDLAKDGKHLLLPFSAIEFRKHTKGKAKMMDTRTTEAYLKHNQAANDAMLKLVDAGKLSHKAYVTMSYAQANQIRYFLKTHIAENDPIRGEVEGMLVAAERPLTYAEKIMAMGEARGEARGRAEGESKRAQLEAELAEMRAKLAKYETEKLKS